MEDNKRHVVLLSLLETMRARGSWCGETHVQKSTYFLQEALDVPLELSFVLYKHGPFSFDLSDVLGEMRAYLLIDIEPRDPYGPSLKVSPSGEGFKAHFPKTTARYARQIEFVASRLSQRGVAQLERLGTALYVTKEDGSRSVEARAHRINELKPHVPVELACQAVEEVDSLLAEARELASTA